MMGREQNLKKGVRFSADNQPPNRGRKPSRLKSLVKPSDLSRKDITNLFLSLLDMTQAEAVEFMAQKEIPLSLKTYCFSFLKGTPKERKDTVKEMLEFTFGRDERMNVEIETLKIITTVTNDDNIDVGDGS